jgi:cytochrome c oxidase assembly protein subunit 11
MSGNVATARRIALASVLSFGAAFGLVPLYEIACEKVFGIKLETGPAGERRLADIAIDPNRTVRIEFDATVNSKLPWSFEPEQLSMEVVPGQAYEVNYVAGNLDARPVVGNAAPSVAPVAAAGYFVKTECFCFTEQLLAPGEHKVMPVRFIVDPALPAGVRTVTLSYTFFNNEQATARMAAQAQAGARAAP